MKFVKFLVGILNRSLEKFGIKFIRVTRDRILKGYKDDTFLNANGGKESVNLIPMTPNAQTEQGVIWKLVNESKGKAINELEESVWYASFGLYSFLKNYKASGNASLNWSKFNNIQNGIFSTNESFTQSYTIKASTNYKNLPNIELGYSYTINDYSNSKFYTDKPFARLDYYFLESFSFVSEYEFYHYS
jgi:hypothetical protein